MRVGFNARTLSAPQLRGWSRYTSNLCRELTHLDVMVYLLSDRELNPELLKGFNKENLKVIVKKGNFYLHWEQIVLPELCRVHNLDLLHCPINYGLPLRSPCPRVLTLHDAIGKAFYNQDKSWGEKWAFDHVYMEVLNRLSQKASDRVITVSHHAKTDLQKYYGIASDKIDVVYEASDPQLAEFSPSSLEEVEKRWKIKSPYFFYVGGLEKRKNISFLIRAFSELQFDNCQLVLAGGGGDVDFYKKQIQSMRLGERVKLLGWVEDSELPSLYQFSKAFVYPSLYEGFGLQLVEAMSFGVPVIASNRTSLPEVLGNDLATFDPTQEVELQKLIKKVLSDESFCKELSDHSVKRSQDFSWENTARQTKSIYQKLVT